ncbi:hypothetical protein D3C73_1460620 [compost metagenome]
MRFIEIFLDPFPIYLIASAILCQRMHVPRGFLKFSEVIVRIIQKDVLVVDMITVEQQTNR